MKTGNGKIANLPEHLIDQLNWRINTGEGGKRLVDWLNAQPETVEVVNRLFEGKPISEQNLSLWRTNGYLRSQAHDVIMRETAELAQNSGAIKDTGIDCEKMLWALKANYADMIQRWLVTPTVQMGYRMKVFKHLLAAVLAMDRSALQHERLELLRGKQARKSDSPDSSSEQPAPATVPAPPALNSSNGSPSSGPSLNQDPDAAAPASKPVAKTPSPTNTLPKTSSKPSQKAPAPQSTQAPPAQTTSSSTPPTPKTPPYTDPRSLRHSEHLPQRHAPPYTDPRSLR